MKVRCIVCKRFADIPEDLVKAIASAIDDDMQSLTFACSHCMETETNKFAEIFVDKYLFKNANQN